MIIKTSIIQFYCPKCGAIDGRFNRNVGHDVSKVIEAIYIMPTCPKCDITIKVDKVVCKIWTKSDKFGNERYGAWICREHPHRQYYPTPLKDAIKGEYDNASCTVLAQYVHIDMTMLYKKIAEGGYPWKCPICNHFMRYHDEREEGGSFINEAI